jgi:hypothetical protein
MSFLPCSKAHALVSMVTSAKDCMWCNDGNPKMLNNPNPLLSKVEWRRCCIHLTTLNLNHFKAVEAIRLKVVSSTSPAMVSPPYKISSKSIDRFKKLLGGKERQTHTYIDRLTDDLISLLSFWESRLKTWILMDRKEQDINLPDAFQCRHILSFTELLWFWMRRAMLN